MKYTEFTQLMENKGLKTGRQAFFGEEYFVIFKSYEEDELGRVHINYPAVYSADTEASKKISERLRRFIAQACHELAFTDLDDREEEKLYYVKHKWLRGSALNFLNFDEDRQRYFLTDKLEMAGYKVKFTQSEIDALDLSKDWEQVEVE